MKSTNDVLWLWFVGLFFSLTISRSTSQNPRPNYNIPGSWNYDERRPLTGNQGNFYNPIFGNSGIPAPRINISRDGFNRPRDELPEQQDYTYTSKPKPAQSVYPWNFQPSNHNNGYTSRPQPVNQWPTQPPQQNNGYTVRPLPVNRWTTQPPRHYSTLSPPMWNDDRSINHSMNRNGDFDLIDFENLPESYKTAFMSVEELVRNKGIIQPPGENARNVLVVFDNRTQEMLLGPELESLVSNVLPSLVPGTWRSMTYIQGCCSALRYHAANETLLNVNGQNKRIVHFSKYNPPMYQFIPHGLCAHASYSANGHCFQGTLTMSLLVYDLRFNPPLSFDMFNVPSYCNCVQF